jgi:hypothetical protein
MGLIMQKPIKAHRRLAKHDFKCQRERTAKRQPYPRTKECEDLEGLIGNRLSKWFSAILT